MEIRNLKFTVIGGDNRQGYLAQSLAKDGISVTVNGLEKLGTLDKVKPVIETAQAVKNSDVVVLPVPASRDNVLVNAPHSYSPIYLTDIFAAAKPHQIILGGLLNKSLYEGTREKELKLIDYYEREELTVLNAIPTAEGALEIAMRETKKTIFKSNCLVVGYGRIGKVLSNMLKALGANVTATARKYSDLAWIKANGINGIFTDDILNYISQFDIIFNTVPHLVIGMRELLCCKEDVLIIDLASAPGGVDYNAASQCGIKTIHALSLPGKVAPESAAEIIKETLINIIKEIN
ncbi:MAG TPA: dipicolinate synthase subunit DpsA [Clostridiales bacterium]|nr:dipicolinate synthase subunit DpsA [Clostridiales bacterium]